MKIGVAKESAAGEQRVALTPDAVKKLSGKGFEIQMETGAGLAAHFTDTDYEASDASIVDRKAALAAQIVVKVRKPSSTEVAGFSPGAIYISLTETCGDDEILSAMRAKNVTILSMERIPRISRAQSMDALSSQSNIAGYRAVIEQCWRRPATMADSYP